MASARRKSAAIALAVVGVAGLSLASASTLNVSGGTIQAGTTTSASCDADGVQAKFTSSYAAAPTNAYKADTLTISGIDAACADGDMRVSVVADKTTVEFTATKIGQTWTSTAISPVIPAAEIKSVAVVITK
ncbi:MULTISPECIES: hypothetical protein [unclassified Actinotalea]|uniref:hypothetical protein n=1 Tax=unclassified Actinotalea TaxID=2638618 RepID=UPI0015F3B6A7|nr:MULTISPECIES: hypothetical protein [unclassified Actinotalea]